MWKNVGQDTIMRVEGLKHKLASSKALDFSSKAKRNRSYWRVDCQSASKGLFLGLLCLVGGIIILIIFFVMKVDGFFLRNISRRAIVMLYINLRNIEH